MTDKQIKTMIDEFMENIGVDPAKYTDMKDIFIGKILTLVQPVQKLYRENVTKAVQDHPNCLKDIVDQILALISPQPKMSEQSIRDILEELIDPDGDYIDLDDDCKLKFNKDDIDKAVQSLLKLYKPLCCMDCQEPLCIEPLLEGEVIAEGEIQYSLENKKGMFVIGKTDIGQLLVENIGQYISMRKGVRSDK